MKQRTRTAAIGLALALSGGGLVACGEDETVVEEAEEAGTGELLVGETVTIEGEVEQRVGPNAFTVGADETLVFGADAPDVEDDDVVTVTGEVVEFVVADVERDFDLDLDDELFVDFENELAVNATEVEITEEG